MGSKQDANTGGKRIIRKTVDIDWIGVEGRENGEGVVAEGKGIGKKGDSDKHRNTGELESERESEVWGGGIRK